MKPKGTLIRMAEVISPTEVRLFFSDGLVVERPLPGVDGLQRVRVIDDGLGIDPGDGKGDLSAWGLRRACPGRRVYCMRYTD